MSLTVYWTRFAENKIEDIYEYYELNAGVSVALKLVHGIIDRTIRLEKNPYIGPKEKLLEKREQEFRYLVHKSYKIIYWVNLIGIELKLQMFLIQGGTQKKWMKLKRTEN